jgi:hypothetical protein
MTFLYASRTKCNYSVFTIQCRDAIFGLLTTSIDVPKGPKSGAQIELLLTRTDHMPLDFIIAVKVLQTLLQKASRLLWCGARVKAKFGDPLLLAVFNMALQAFNSRLFVDIIRVNIVSIDVSVGADRVGARPFVTEGPTMVICGYSVLIGSMHCFHAR